MAEILGNGSQPYFYGFLKNLFIIHLERDSTICFCKTPGRLFDINFTIIVKAGDDGKSQRSGGKSSTILRESPNLYSVEQEGKGPRNYTCICGPIGCFEWSHWFGIDFFSNLHSNANSLANNLLCSHSHFINIARLRSPQWTKPVSSRVV